MPSISVTTLDKVEIKTAELKGKVLLINFWATWCPPCLAELPRLEKEVWQKYKSANFVMVAIAREQTNDEIKEFRDKNHLTFPLASDLDREIYKVFGNGGIPRSYIVGTDGKILYQSIGYDSGEFDRMLKILNQTIQKKDK